MQKLLMISTLVICALIAGCTSINPVGVTIAELRVVSDEDQGKWPIVYSPGYNISFGGLERLHPFDTHKYGRVYKELNEAGILSGNNHFVPLPPDDSILLKHHSQDYLEQLETAKIIAEFTEIGPVKWLPDSTAYKSVVAPMKLATSGSILAGELALKYGWAVNLSGGYHHASKDIYGGFCAISDISLSIAHLRENHSNLINVLIVDLDAHQGNGHERDFIGHEGVYILDVYNAEIYPNDRYAKQAIGIKVELQSFTTDKEYLEKVDAALGQAFENFDPQIIFYIAGTDVLEGDRLGKLSVTSEGVLTRDQLVFDYAFQRDVPIVMLLGGGYQRNNAATIAQSIQNLIQEFELRPTN